MSSTVTGASAAPADWVPRRPPRAPPRPRPPRHQPRGSSSLAPPPRRQQVRRADPGRTERKRCRMGVPRWSWEWSAGWEGLEYREGSRRRPASADHQDRPALLEPPVRDRTGPGDRAAWAPSPRAIGPPAESQLVERRARVSRVLGDEPRRAPRATRQPGRRSGLAAVALQLPNDPLAGKPSRE